MLTSVLASMGWIFAFHHYICMAVSGVGVLFFNVDMKVFFKEVSLFVFFFERQLSLKLMRH
ncbi:hypothetical protein HanRHA438_Chr10g0461551 [Helianthus annuus]|nr:hypothetical protein HanRHA438_Chr10g0461551 [Helianthus annuus]